MKDIVVVIPAYEPSETLIRLVRALRSNFRHIVVVDDGSAPSCAVFPALRDIGGITLLRHETNRGKGAALKTAFAHVLAHIPEAVGVVTADADGQHVLEDIRKVAAEASRHPDRLTLGVRSFSGDIPFRSRFGNIWTRIEFRLLTGVSVQDTQTGLRGIPASWLPDLLAIEGDRYEYEIRMLVYGSRAKRKPAGIPISTVYLDGNSASHFRPFKDTLRTQTALISAAFSRRSP
jgi:dolichol-phosphate mannosyltransferase